MLRIAFGIVLGAAGTASAYQLTQSLQIAPGQAVRLTCAAPNGAATRMTPNNVTPPSYASTVFNVFCDVR